MEKRNPYHILEVTIEATEADIFRAFTAGMTRNPGDFAWARGQLLDPHLRLQWDSRVLEEDRWFEQLRRVREQYAVFDFLAGLR